MTIKGHLMSKGEQLSTEQTSFLAFNSSAVSDIQRLITPPIFDANIRVDLVGNSQGCLVLRKLVGWCCQAVK